MARIPPDLYEVSKAAQVGRHVVAWSIFILAALWTLQLYRGGGTSGIMTEVHRLLGDAATWSFGVASVVMLFGLFFRAAKIAGAFLFSTLALVAGLVGAQNGHLDVGVMMLLSLVPLGFAVALMAMVGEGR